MFPDFQIPLYFVTISKYMVNNLFLGHTKVHTKMHFRDSHFLTVHTAKAALRREVS